MSQDILTSNTFRRTANEIGLDAPNIVIGGDTLTSANGTVTIGNLTGTVDIVGGVDVVDLAFTHLTSTLGITTGILDNVLNVYENIPRTVVAFSGPQTIGSHMWGSRTDDVRTLVLQIDGFTANATADMVSTTAIIPATWRPNANVTVPCVISDNGTNASGRLLILTSGVIQLAPTNAATNFTNAHVYVIGQVRCSYAVDS